MKNHVNRFIDILPWILTLIFGFIMIRTTIPNGHDLTVYYIAAKEAFSDQGIYSIARDGNLVFKYPPWIVTFFLPFSFFELETAKMLWGVVQAASLFYCVKYLIENKISSTVISIVLLSFAPLWIIHAYSGQIALPTTALALFLERCFTHNRRGFAFIGLTTALSSKLFTMLPLLAFHWRKKDIKWIVSSGLFWILLCLPFIFYEGMGLFSGWLEAIQSGKPIEGSTRHVGQIHVTPISRDHQGWISFFFKNFGGNPENALHLVLVTLLVAFCILIYWKWRTRTHSKKIQWLGWVAWLATIHPLSGFFSFVCAFPLACFSLNRAIQSKDRQAICLSIIGILFLTAITQKSIGVQLGSLAETWCVKSFGVLLLSWSMTRT